MIVGPVGFLQIHRDGVRAKLDGELDNLRDQQGSAD
jgi:hypothetical protein